MTTTGKRAGVLGWAGGRQLHDKAYFLDLLGDGQTGLGRHEAAIEAYRQAAEGFKSQGGALLRRLVPAQGGGQLPVPRRPWTRSRLPPGLPPLLHELGLTRHEDARARAAGAVPIRGWPGRGTHPRASEPKQCAVAVYATRVDSVMPGTDGQPRWLSADEQQAWRATVHLSQLLMRQLDRDLNAPG